MAETWVIALVLFAAGAQVLQLLLRICTHVRQRDAATTTTTGAPGCVVCGRRCGEDAATAVANVRNSLESVTVADLRELASVLTDSLDQANRLGVNVPDAVGVTTASIVQTLDALPRVV